MTETVEMGAGSAVDDPPGYQVTLVTDDGIESSIRCQADTPVLIAAEQAGMILQSACRAGGCGACSAVLADGRVEMIDHDPDVIDIPEHDGGILLCCSFVREDSRIELPYDRSKVVTAPPTQRPARIIGMEQVAAGVMWLKLSLCDESGTPTSAEFESGQFVRITVPGTDQSRAYSPANVANWDGELEFYIRRLPGGVMSDYLQERATIGDVLSVSNPQGIFTLKENGLRPRWFIGGGTGLSPLLSMMRRMAEWGDPQPVRLFFGVTHPSEVYAQEELAELGTALADFRADTLVWHPEGQWSGAVGTPADLAAAEVATLTEWPDVYTCGPPSMVDAVFTLLSAVGVPHEQMHAERFSAVT